MTETELIARVRGRVGAAGHGVRVGIGDDAAVLRVGVGEELVVTTDFCVEGRHFRRDWHTAESVGHRALARGLSDVAAMGARPVAAFLSLGLPRGFEEAWVEEFFTGLLGLAGRLGVTLAGGDTAEVVGDGVIADICCVGAVRRGKALLRSGAKVGDRVFVSGELGGAAVELARMAGGERGLRGVGSFPEPRVGVGRRLVGVATACMDLSDGLGRDLGRLAEASGVGVRLEAERIPVAVGATLDQGMYGGEDYELLFTAGGRVPGKVAGVRVTEIGRVVEGSGVWLDGEELEVGGWEHFG